MKRLGPSPSRYFIDCGGAGQRPFSMLRRMAFTAQNLFRFILGA